MHPFIKSLKSSIGISIAGALLSLLGNKLPDFYLFGFFVYLAIVCWVINPIYDTDALNSALFYFLRAIGITDTSPRHSCCIYIPDITGKNLRMVSDYVPTLKKSPYIEHFKKISESKGAIGLAYRRKETVIDIEVAQITSIEEKTDHLKKWGFSDGDIGFMSSSWKGICAIPILEPERAHQKSKCIGVLYFATDDEQLLQDSQFVDKMESAAMMFEPLLRLMKK